jgi:hypothetical protein
MLLQYLSNHLGVSFVSVPGSAEEFQPQRPFEHQYVEGDGQYRLGGIPGESLLVTVCLIQLEQVTRVHHLLRHLQ